MNNGCYYWELNIKPCNSFFTFVTIGIGTNKARLRSSHIGEKLIGIDSQSWGMTSCFLEKKWYLLNGNTKRIRQRELTFGVLFDGIEGTVTYFKDGMCLGIGFDGLHKIKSPIYPMVASSRKASIKLVCTKMKFVKLQDRCRAAFLDSYTSVDQLTLLHLPSDIKSYLSSAIHRTLLQDEEKDNLSKLYKIIDSWFSSFYLAKFLPSLLFI